MEPEQFIAFVASVRVNINKLIASANAMEDLVRRVEEEIDRTDPIALPLSQAEVDHIFTVYAPLWAAAGSKANTDLAALGF